MFTMALPPTTAYLLLSPVALFTALVFDRLLAKGEKDAAREGIDPSPLRLMRWALWPAWAFAALTLLAAGLSAQTTVVAGLLSVAAACGLVMLGGLVWLAAIEYGPFRKRKL